MRQDLSDPNWIMNPANPLSPISPLNPMNQASTSQPYNEPMDPAAVRRVDHALSALLVVIVVGFITAMLTHLYFDWRRGLRIRCASCRIKIAGCIRRMDGNPYCRKCFNRDYSDSCSWGHTCNPSYGSANARCEYPKLHHKNLLT